MKRESSEKIIISAPQTAAEPDEARDSGQPIQCKWRKTSTGLTPLGGLMAFGCILLVILMPRIMTKFVISGFWNSPWGTRRSLFLSDIVGWALLDEDYGHVGSYAIGIVFAMLLFYCISQLLETMGYLIYREGDS